MKLVAVGLTLASAFAVALQGQSAPASAFEVADVHSVTRSAALAGPRNIDAFAAEIDPELRR